MTQERETVKRRRRIERIKKTIIVVILSAIIIPITTTAIFAFLFLKTKNQLSDLQTRYDDLIETMDQLRDTVTYEAPEQDVFSTSEVEVSPRDMDEETENTDMTDEPETEITKYVYLTFDDGPSSNTDKILDILDEYGVKATFFVTGKTDDVSIAAYKRIVEGGHTLGMHSYSHKYSQIYASKEAFSEDLKQLQEFLYEETGVWSRYYRFPGGSSNTASSVDMNELMKYLDDNDITYFDWNIVSGDATGRAVSAETIYNNCISKLDKYDDAFILMHDASAKNSTVEALPKLIEAIQAIEGTKIVPIDDDTVPVQHRTLQ